MTKQTRDDTCGKSKLSFSAVRLVLRVSILYNIRWIIIFCII